MANNMTDTDAAKRSWPRAVAIVLVAGVTAFALVKFIIAAVGYERDTATYDDATATFTAIAEEEAVPQATDADDGYIDSEEDEAPAPEGTQTHLETCPITVDFAELQSASSAVVGWIYCEGTRINYPIVQGEDDAYYLKHDYTGKWASAGSIVMTYLSAPDWSDPNTILYGHSMKNGTMFHDVRYWQNASFATSHPVMWILTPDKTYKVELFSAYRTYDMSESYTMFISRGKAFEEYLADVKDKSVFESDVVLDTASNYVMLSTCVFASGSARYVLHGKLVEV